MSYNQINVTKFEGLNSTVAPELISDGAARDIMNFRMEKVGKLVSRNGIIFGLFTDPTQTLYPDETTVTDPWHPDDYYTENKGLIGIGEMILEEVWDLIDTDRLMVYVIRSEKNDEFHNTTDDTHAQNRRHKESYLFSPMSGKFKNILMTNYVPGAAQDIMPPVQVVERRDNKAQDSNVDFVVGGSTSSDVYTTQLYAPNRWLPCDSDNTEKGNDYWIDRYIDMNQYRHKVVISDRVNGDMILEDLYSRRDREGGACLEADHSLHLRPNCLDPFDIDIVELDSRFRGKEPGVEDEENSYSKGVTHGMGLYKYILPKMIKRASDLIVNAPTISDENWTGKTAPGAIEKCKSAIATNNFTAPLNFINYRYIDEADPDPVTNYTWYSYGFTLDTADANYTNTPAFFTLAIPTSRYYYLSNAKINEEVDNLYGALELSKDEFVDTTQTGTTSKKNDGGILITDYSPEVFVWDEYKLQYYPCSGKILLSQYNWFLQDIDRFFTKLTPGIPKIKRLNVKHDMMRYVPLGIWKYRFVWDYGNGNYSAPSATLLSPEIMWSAIDDPSMTFNGNYEERPKNYQNEYNKNFQGTHFDGEQYKSPMAITTSSIYTHAQFVMPRLFDSSTANGAITTAGQLYRDLKDKLFFTTYTYGANTQAGLIPWMSHTNSIADIFTNILLDTPVATEIEGLYWEGIGIVDAEDPSDRIWYNPDWASEQIDRWNGITPTTTHLVNSRDRQAIGRATLPKQSLIQASGKLIIPCFRTSDNLCQNTLFDDEGRFRHLIAPKIKNNIDSDTGQAYKFRHQLVLREYNYGIGKNYRRTFFDLTDLNNIPYALYQKSRNWFHNIIFAQYYQQDNSIYYNCIVDDDDKNNNNLTTQAIRPYSLIRAIKDQGQSFLNNTNSLIPNEVIDRLILRGDVKLNIISPSEKFWYDCEYYEWDRIIGPFPTAGGGFYWTIMGVDDVRDNYEDAITSSLPYTPGQHYHGGISITNSAFDYLKRNPIYPDDPPFDTQDNWFNAEKAPIVLRSDLLTNPYPNDSINTQGTVKWGYDHHVNHDINIYLPGERFIGLEQLSSYFPSSLLFGAPRMGIKIHNDDIPEGAKQLLIFRTKCSHANDWQPNEYGLIDTVPIRRVSQEEAEVGSGKQYFEGNTEVPFNDAISEMINGTITHQNEINKKFYHGIYYFDKIRDDNIDWSRTPGEYEGLRNAISSAFNIALNERMYYLNFLEAYQPIAPRKNEYISVTDEEIYTINKSLHSAHARIFPITQSMIDSGSVGLLSGSYSYRYVYVDQASILSPYKQVDVIIDAGALGNNGTVVLYLMAHSFDEYIKYVQIYRSKDGSPYYYIGKTDAGDEGIFLDDGLPDGVVMPCTQPDVENYESGLRWSEPFRPDWIKAESFAEYRSGDGKQATGIETLYGNLVIFKETSMHRVAVQAINPPLSRTDEISAEVGCIAPNTLININNTLYFLSWKGLMSYDNNVLKKVDGLFDEELQYILTNTEVDFIRDCSCGYNPVYNELYLNVPMLKTMFNQDDPTGNQYDFGQGFMYEKDDINGKQFWRTLLGHIYVVNLDKGYATKFSYQASTRDPEAYETWIKKTIHPLQLIRKYYTNSLGEMRSGDILPNYYGNVDRQFSVGSAQIFLIEHSTWNPTGTFTITGSTITFTFDTNWRAPSSVDDNGMRVYQDTGTPAYDINTMGLVIDTGAHSYTWPIQTTPGVHELIFNNDGSFYITYEVLASGTGMCWAGIYIETPYLEINDHGQEISLWDVDDVLDSRQIIIDLGVDFKKVFPQDLHAPIHSAYKSKFFTGDDESLLKRVRKIVFNVFSRGPITSRGITISGEGLYSTMQNAFFQSDVYGDNRIDNTQFRKVDNINEFHFPPTIMFNPDAKIVRDNSYLRSGSGSNIISFIPTTPQAQEWNDRDGNTNRDQDDFIGKPIRFSIELDCYLRTQLNEIALHWRPIHSYLS